VAFGRALPIPRGSPGDTRGSHTVELGLDRSLPNLVLLTD